LNTYITTKISYAKLLARLAKTSRAGRQRRDLCPVGLDSRIGSKYLKGAVSMVAPASPRQCAFAALAARSGASLIWPWHRTLQRSQIGALAILVKSHQSGGDPIGILGLPTSRIPMCFEESFGCCSRRNWLRESSVHRL